MTVCRAVHVIIAESLSFVLKFLRLFLPLTLATNSFISHRRLQFGSKGLAGKTSPIYIHSIV